MPGDDTSVGGDMSEGVTHQWGVAYQGGDTSVVGGISGG